ncbi:unnamed protein product [Arctogadus glacialis]
MTFRLSPPSSKRSSGCSPKRCESTGDVKAMIKTSRDVSVLPERSKLPYIPSLAKSTDGACRRVYGCANLTKSLLATKGQEASGSHFLFDKTYDHIQRTGSLIPPLPKNYHVHRTGKLQPIGAPHGQGRPLSLSSCEGYSLGTNPTFLLPSALVLNKRNTISVDHCLLNRPKGNQRTYNLLTIKDIQKGQGSFPDPVAGGAPYPFLQRVSELAALEGDTARQEKLVKSKNRKQES